MSSLIKKIIKPISSKNKAGKCLEDSVLRDFLDTETMKIGTLQHGEIDWKKVEQQATRFLSSECKDFKVLSYLIMGLQNNGNPERFLTSIHLLCKFAETYWKTGFPKPGKSGVLVKKKIIRLILDRSLESAQGLKVFESDTEFLSGFNDLEKVVGTALKMSGVRYTGIDKIPKLFIKKLKDLETNVSSEVSKNSYESETNPSIIEAPGEFKVSNDREIKQSYLKLAKLTNEIEITNPLGFQLRRFAIWHSISAAPPKNKKGHTEMAPVPLDRVAEYTESITQEASVALLIRIEHTISTSPFWIYGSYLAALCASKLKQPHVAENILVATVEFITRVPALKQSCFSDGSSFVDNTTLEWLESVHAQKTETTGDDYQVIYDTDGLEAVLSSIDVVLKKSQDQREIFHLRFRMAYFLYKSGLLMLSKQQAEALLSEINSMMVRDWEPSFIKKIQKLIK